MFNVGVDEARETLEFVYDDGCKPRDLLLLGQVYCEMCCNVSGRHRAYTGDQRGKAI